MVPNIVKYILFIFILSLASCNADSIIESSKTPEISSESFNYPSSQYKFEIGETIPKIVPILKDRGVFIYSVEPELPPGFYIDEQIGGFGGFAIAISPKQTYTFKANLSGVGVEYQYQVEISVTEPLPQLLGYPQDPLKIVFAEFLPPTFPVVIGSVDSFLIEPLLPSGLFFDPLTGAIAGTPITLNYENIHYLSATNSGGTVTVPIRIKVTEKFPTAVTYSSSSYTCLAYLACLVPAPIIAPIGVLGVEFTVSPPLPPGYTLDTMTGEISAAFKDLVLASPLATYTVTAANEWGSQSASFTLETVLAAPIDLGYGAVAINVFKDVPLAAPIAPSLPTPANAAIELYEVVGSSGPNGTFDYFPGGLQLNSQTGEITGTPNTPVGTYTLSVRGTNSLGSTISIINLEVLLQPVTMLNYPTFPSYILTGQALPRYEPTYTGTAPDFYTITSDPLPAGLLFNDRTGIFYGTPTTAIEGFNVSITATNKSTPVDIVSAPIVFDINISNPAPTSIVYPQATYTVQACSDISLIPNIAGGAPSSVVSDPVINIADQFPPTDSSIGLSINQTTGEISGNVSAYYPAAKGYLIQASNLAGMTSTPISIITSPDAPDFTMDDFYPSRGIPEIKEMNLNSCFNQSTPTVSPALPSEFSLSTTNNIIYSGSAIGGVAPSLIPKTNYSLSLTNTAGTQADTFSLGLKYRLGSSRNQAETAFADFDQDGNTDIIAADATCLIYSTGDCSQGHLSVLRYNSPNGEFTELSSQTTQLITGIGLYNHFENLHAQDMDADTFPDLMYYDRFQQKIVIMKNNAGGSFSFLSDFILPTAPTHIIYKDLNANGIDEIITVDGTSNITIYEYSAGVFTPTVHAINSLSEGISSIAAAKINGDAFIDLVAIDESDDTICAIRATANNVFESDCFGEKIQLQPEAKKIYSAPMTTGDNDDLVIIHQNSVSSISVLRNDGNDFGTKTISTPPALTKLVNENIIEFGDMNSDGTTDIILASLELTLSDLHIFNGATLFSSPAAAVNIEYPNIRSLTSGRFGTETNDALVSCHENAGLGVCQIDYSVYSPFSF